jgi:hypothetical protein
MILGAIYEQRSHLRRIIARSGCEGVEGEQAADALTASDNALGLTEFGIDELVVDPLVIPLAVVMGGVLPGRVVERAWCSPGL